MSKPGLPDASPGAVRGPGLDIFVETGRGLLVGGRVTRARQRQIVWKGRPLPQDRPFLQPVAVAVVSAIFVVLIVVIGYLDLQRSEENLIHFMEDQGRGLVQMIERLSDENIENLRQAFQLGRYGFSVRRDEILPLEERLTSMSQAIGELAPEIDRRWRDDQAGIAFLRALAEEKNIWLIAFLDRHGNVLAQTRPLPDAWLAQEKEPPPPASPDVGIGLLTRLVAPFDFLQRPVLPQAVHDRIAADSDDRIRASPFLRTLHRMRGEVVYVTVTRKDTGRTIVFVLDRPRFEHWAMKVSVAEAVKKLGDAPGQGLVYVSVADAQNRSLGQAGRIPERWAPGQMPVGEILAGQRTVKSRTVLYEGRQVLDMATPFRLGQRVAGVARLGLERAAADRIIAENRQNIAIFVGLVVLVVIGLMWLLFHNQNRHLAGIVEMERQLVKAERLSALGLLAAGVAHEIRNPLNAISMASQRLKRQFAPEDEGAAEEFHSLAGVIRDEIRRLNGIIEEFLTFSRSRRLQRQDCAVAEVLQKIVLLVREEAAVRDIAIETDWGSAPTVLAMDVDKLQQALLNIIKNAMESIAGAGKIAIAVKKPPGRHLVIRIADTGCGMTTEEVERIFNPEYTTKEKGLGLGLPLAHEIIRGHDGEIRVYSREGEGTTFEILLPAETVNGRPARG